MKEQSCVLTKPRPPAQRSEPLHHCLIEQALEQARGEAGQLALNLVCAAPAVDLDWSHKDHHLV